MPSLRSDKQDDADEGRMNIKGYKRGMTARKCKLQLYKSGKQELNDFRKVSIKF